MGILIISKDIEDLHQHSPGKRYEASLTEQNNKQVNEVIQLVKTGLQEFLNKNK